MNKTKENLLLHPVRLRVILAAAGRTVTARQLAAELPDVPAATLYRNVNVLAAGGILQVVGERRVRNAIEKTYAISDEGLLLTMDDLKNAQPEDYVRLFTQFLGQLLGYFVRYAQSGSPDLARDQLIFQMVPVYLSKAETRKLYQTLNEDLRPLIKHEPSAERRRFVLGIMSLPDAAAGGAAAMSQKRPAQPKKGRKHG